MIEQKKFTPNITESEFKTFDMFYRCVWYAAQQEVDIYYFAETCPLYDPRLHAVLVGRPFHVFNGLERIPNPRPDCPDEPFAILHELGHSCDETIMFDENIAARVMWNYGLISPQTKEIVVSEEQKAWDIACRMMRSFIDIRHAKSELTDDDANMLSRRFLSVMDKAMETYLKREPNYSSKYQPRSPREAMGVVYGEMFRGRKVR